LSSQYRCSCRCETGIPILKKEINEGEKKTSTSGCSISLFLPAFLSLSLSLFSLAMAQKRLAKELKDMSKDTLSNCSAGMIGDDLFNWQATIIGPKDTPYDKSVSSVIFASKLQQQVQIPLLCSLTRVCLLAMFPPSSL
jgi:hypothetical protein